MFDIHVKTRRAIRQGDILLLPCRAIPTGVQKQVAEGRRVVLAHGETTGHSHTMPADRVCLFREDGSGGGVFLRVGGRDTVALTHEEHAPLAVPPGSYRVVRQREYQPRALPRAIVD